MKKYQRLLALILVITVLITSLPMQVMAEQINNVSANDTIENATLNEETKSKLPEPRGTQNSTLPEKNKAKIIGEIVEEREKNVKRFLKEDGSYEAAVYPRAVHYKEGNEWKDIDNSLIESVSEEDNQGVLENKQNSFKVKLAKNTKSKKLVKIKKDNYELSWGIDNALDSTGQVKAKDSNYINSLSEDDKKKTLNNINSIVDFKDVYQNVDFRYNIAGEDVKEDIIIKDKIENSIFKFNIELKNILPKLLEDNSIVFYDINDPSKQVFSLDAPFMYDAKGEETKDIQVSIQQDEKGYVLTITPNNEWINSSERAYPVVIDPSVSTSLDKSKIYDAHVSQNYPTTNYKDSVMLKTGKGASSGINRSYISFVLPGMSTGDLITNANLDLALYTTNSNKVQIDAHKVLGSWDLSTLTWNNKPSYNSKIDEYELVQGTSGQFFSWNITSIVKEWYSTGNNYGLMLKNHDESVGYNEYFSANTSLAYEIYRPQVTIDYVNNSGLESYWTYHSQDLGRAGTSYLNDYNGNLVLVHDDLEMNGNRMPISLNHVFNSNNRERNIGYGFGWRLNLNQTINYQVINGTTYYVYTDEDATKHYLAYDSVSQVYKDESGLDLTMTIDSSTTVEKYKLKDKGGNQLSFNSAGYLTYITDNNGNKITLEYTNNILTKVTDGSGRVTELKIDANNRLSSIIDPSGRTTTFSYTSDQLNKITYPDNKYTIYEYTASNNLIGAINADGYKMSYSYYSVAPYRIKNIEEKHTNGTLGEKLDIVYGYNTTTFTDYNGRKNIYQFNDQGNTVSIQDHNGNAQYYKYLEDGGNKNKLSSQSKLQKTVSNYIINHNIEQSGNWYEFSYWGSTANISFTTEEKYIGNQSLKIEKTNTLGDHNYYQTLAVEKGKTYTLSGYMKTNNISNVSNKGAAIYITYQAGDGTWMHVYSDYVTGTKNWDRYEVKFTLPADAMTNEVRVKAGINGETGIAYFDNLQLEDGSIANRYNLVENPDLKYGTGIPTFWYKNSESDASDTLTTVTGQPLSLDSNVFKINGVAEKHKTIYQTFDISGNAGDTFVFGGWAKGESVPSTKSTGRYFALEIGIKRTDGSFQWVAAHFNEDSNQWQYTSNVVVADSNYTKILIQPMYYNNANSAYFDGLQLYKEEFGESYQYDSNGNIISTKDLAKQQSQFQYNTNNDLIKATDPKGNNFNYSYDSKHNLLNATSAENVVYSFTHDSYGNPLTAKVGDDTLFINSSSTYTANGNYTKTLTDSEGNIVTYNYDETKGNLDSLVDVNGKTTSYSYDNIDRLESVSKVADGVNITNSYSYENNKLKTITHNGFSYNFGYDSLGNNTTVSVGTQNLITNIYEARTSKLLESKYGNNQRISYVYDNEDRVISEKYIDSSNNTHERYKYEYDASGNVGYHEDLVNGLSYRYIYDLSDRLVKIKESNGNTVSYEYDKNNNNSKVVEKVNNNTYTTSYGYDKDNRPTNLITPKGKTTSYIYDPIGRIDYSTIDTGIQYKTDYTYKSGINGATTTKVESIDNGGKKISYTYDKNGNIETITENGKVIKYYYNELNELKREDNQALNKTIVYTYDVGGNILTKIEYPYTTGTPSNPTKTYDYNYNDYNYNDSNWKDKLTNFDGREITYDQIGNPLTYNGWTYNWEEGRQLAGLSGNGLNILYKYNSDGIRTEKKVGEVTTKYHVAGDKVTFETNGSDNIYYTYDSNDNLVSMELNGVEYYYVRNVQGDIIGLIDGNGTQVVTYTYDSWGKLISIEGSLKDTLGIKNPYRYRGYRYDTETGLYYLQSRYYNAEWGRFINADNIAGSRGVLLSHNVFAYCINNPVNQSDEGGFIAPAVVVAAYMYACSIASSPDTQQDLQFIAMNIARRNYLAAALDLVGVLVPGATGLGQLAKPGQKVTLKLLRAIDRSLEGTAKSSSTKLRKSLIEAGKKVPGFANAAHHIVAGNAVGSKKARLILKKYSIDINSAYNGAFLSKSYHSRLHTKAYYTKVNDLLGEANSRSEAIEILNDIASQLRNGKF